MTVTVIEVIGLRIVIVHRQFDQPQTKKASVEVQILLWVTGNRGDMMDAKNLFTHVRISSTSIHSAGIFSCFRLNLITEQSRHTAIHGV